MDSNDLPAEHFDELPSQEEMFGALFEAAQRIAALEARVEEQELALRRALALLIDWIEQPSMAA